MTEPIKGKVELHLSAGGPSRILVDGVDLGGITSGVQVQMDADDMPTVYLTLVPVIVTVNIDEAEVLMESDTIIRVPQKQ
jgi:hypothetical protein